MDYGVVASLKQTIECLVRSPQSEMILSNSEIESLSEQLLHLRSFLGTIKLLPSSNRVDSSSERRIKDAAQEFEDLIDSHIISNSFPLGSSDQSSSSTYTFSKQVLKINQKITSLIDEEEDQYPGYGAIASLKQKIERLRQSTKSNIHLLDTEIRSNRGQLGHLQSFLDTIINSSPCSNGVDSSSERRVKAAAKEFEDVIDTHISGSDQSSSLTFAFSQQLLKVNQEITSLTQRLMAGEEQDQYEQMDYGAVASLEQKIEHLVRYTQSRIVLSESETASNFEEIDRLNSFLNAMDSLPISNRVVDSSSNRRHKDAAKEFEDLIDSRMSDLLLSVSDRSSSLTCAFNQHLLKVKQEITSLTQKIMTNGEEEYWCKQQPSDDSFDPSLRIDDYGGDEEMESLQKELRSWILSTESQLGKMLIGGMAGIGKTTLARRVFDHPDVQGEFDMYSFVTVGPQSKLQEILLLVLRGMTFCDGGKPNEVFLMDNASCIGDHLYQILLKKKYLIVLDNMWNNHVWKKLKCFFPDDENGSRVVLTSRLLDFGGGGSVDFMEIPLLNVDQSWNLLRKLVFTAEERCSMELEKIGKKIAKNCEGLPLAIIEVGKLLSKTEKTVENWKILAEKEDPLTITIDDNTPLSEALSLSYMMLPQYLKVCFLYMAVFPKNYKIPPSKLINLWVSEGIVAPEENKSLEETAEECLNTLVSQSVVFNNNLSSIGTSKTKTCRLHFTFRNLGVSEANSEKFVGIIKKYIDDSFPENLTNQNRLCFHNNIVLGFNQVHSWMESIPNARSLLCFGPKQQYPISLYLPFRLLKVLDAVAIRFYEFPDSVLDLFHLRYLAITCDRELPSSISRLRNLEVLVVGRHQIIKRSNLPVYLPIEIWKLHKLKHLQCMGLDLPDPSSANDDSLVLTKLLTLSGVGARSCTVGVLARIPNLKKIGIKIESAHDSVETFSFLGGDRFASLYDKFESFKCVLECPSLVRSVSSVPINFPVNIKKITLSGCGFPWEYMRVIAELPNLQVLKLRWYAFCGPVWETSNGKFRNLKFLLLEDLDLIFLDSGGRDFPKLARMIVRHCYKLEEIPRRLLFSIPLVEVDDCGDSLTQQMKRLQQGYEHSGIRVHFSGDDKKPK